MNQLSHDGTDDELATHRISRLPMARRQAHEGHRSVHIGEAFRWQPGQAVATEPVDVVLDALFQLAFFFVEQGTHPLNRCQA